MNPNFFTPETISAGVYGNFHFLGEIFLKWLPGVGFSLFGPQSDMTTIGQMPPITSAVTLPQAYNFLESYSSAEVYDNVFNAWATFVGYSLVFTLVCLCVLVYVLIRHLQVHLAVYKYYEAQQHTVSAKDKSKTQLRWSGIEESVQSDIPSAWRTAILEADIMLSELLDVQGYKGTTMADKMRNVPPGQFATIQTAWEAHRARNMIAHEGENYALTRTEATRLIALYEKVFREFGLVL